MRVFVPEGLGRHATCLRWPHARAFSCGTCGPSVPTLEDAFARAVGEEWRHRRPSCPSTIEDTGDSRGRARASTAARGS